MTSPKRIRKSRRGHRRFGEFASLSAGAFKEKGLKPRYARISDSGQITQTLPNEQIVRPRQPVIRPGRRIAKWSTSQAQVYHADSMQKPF
jgi:hypothetical protein